MAMTNAALQAMITEFGGKIQMIVFDNDMRVYIGYPSSPCKSIDQIKFKSYGGVDMIGIPHLPMHPKNLQDGMTMTFWHPTSIVQEVVVVECEKDPDRLMDPMDRP